MRKIQRSNAQKMTSWGTSMSLGWSSSADCQWTPDLNILILYPPVTVTILTYISQTGYKSPILTQHTDTPSKCKYNGDGTTWWACSLVWIGEVIDFDDQWQHPIAPVCSLQRAKTNLSVNLGDKLLLILYIAFRVNLSQFAYFCSCEMYTSRQ